MRPISRNSNTDLYLARVSSAHEAENTVAEKRFHRRDLTECMLPERSMMRNTIVTNVENYGGSEIAKR